jgi:hypothetical protein
LADTRAKDREEHEEEQRVSEGADHTGAAEDDQTQGFVDDVWEHGAQEKHWAEN